MRVKALLGFALGSVFLAACSQADAPTAVPSATATRVIPAPTATLAASGTSPTPTATAERTIILPSDEVPAGLQGDVAEQPVGRPPFSPVQWETNFSRRTVDFDTIVPLAGRDTIPPIYQPLRESIQVGELQMGWLQDRHPVAVVEINGESMAYPIGIFTYHEVVNDVIGGVPVLISY